MKCRGRINPHFFLTLTVLLFLIIPNLIFSQILLKGKVTNQTDARPVAYATVSIMNEKGGTVSDPAGNFSINIPKTKINNVLIISCVGFESLNIPVSEAIKKTEFVLTSNVKNLETVTVFKKQEVIGSNSESVGYFRSWNYDHTGGEIGRKIRLSFKEYKIDKIRFKVSNLCDTCLLRVHIRNVIDGKPAEELLKDSVTLTINRLTLDDKIPEFDLTPYDLKFTQNELFVSIEVLNCKSKKNETCSFCFAGTEQGVYIYKSSETSAWETTDDYTIYLKLFLRY